ncbi:hypothetical protein C0J52_23069 [Blattella germanica]|nr:hypothetical protein C0J52_23069 [Blattella germanica]
MSDDYEGPDTISGDVSPLPKTRKAFRQAVFAGIVRRHRKTIFVFGSFMRLLRQGQANTYDPIK